MIHALVVLLTCQLVGETLARWLGLPVPGPVLGMLLLFVLLLSRGSAPEWLTHTARGLLDHLALLFVPAGVGLMVYATQIQSEWPAIVLVLILSTLVTMSVTALTLAVFVRSRASGGKATR